MLFRNGRRIASAARSAAAPRPTARGFSAVKLPPTVKPSAPPPKPRGYFRPIAAVTVATVAAVATVTAAESGYIDSAAEAVAGAAATTVEMGREAVRVHLPRGPHHYNHTTKVRTLRPGEDREKAMQEVYDELRKNAAPGAAGTEVSEAGTMLNVPVLGHVKSTADPTNKMVTNQTQEDHLLHPGKVERRVVLNGDAIEIHTVGTGDGILACLNEATSSILWNRIDEPIARKFGN